MHILALQGNLVQLKVSSHYSPVENSRKELLDKFYDDNDAVFVGGIRAYHDAADAYRAYMRACERRDAVRAAIGAVSRGTIREFSRKSRHRLLSLVARVDEDVSGVMVTFTYRSNMQDYDTSKKHLDLVLRYLKYHYPGAAALWRMEQQQRGAIHYHVMLLTRGHVWVDIAALRAYWHSLVGEVASINVKWIGSRKRAFRYVAKYVAKVLSAPEAVAAQAAVAGNLDSLPYSEKASDGSAAVAARAACEPVSATTSEAADEDASVAPGFVGRFWGVFNRKMMPFAPAHVFEFPDLPVGDYVELTRAVGAWAKSRRRAGFRAGKKAKYSFYDWLYHHVRHAHARAGFTLFADAASWLRWCSRFLSACSGYVPSFA